MRFAPLAALALLPAALADISIIQPSQSEYWVQNTSNTITWEFTNTTGTPSLIDIVVVNEQNTTLDGDFAIASYVDIAALTFTVTDVTLVVGDDYMVHFVNPANTSEVLAMSGYFSVMEPGTSPAASVAVSSAGASSTASGSATASGASGTAASSGSSASTSASAGSNASSAGRVSTGVYGALVACGIAAMSAFLL